MEGRGIVSVEHDVLEPPKTAFQPTFHWEKCPGCLFHAYRVLWKKEQSARSTTAARTEVRDPFLFLLCLLWTTPV
jgi:hypothetical protein